MRYTDQLIIGKLTNGPHYDAGWHFKCLPCPWYVTEHLMSTHVKLVQHFVSPWRDVVSSNGK